MRTADLDASTLIDFINNLIKSWQIFVFVFGAYQFWANRRERLADDKVRNAQATVDSNYQAWQVVNSAQGKGGSGGRIDALANLVRNGQSLAGVNADDAWLEGIDLRGANLQSASFRNANLQGANLEGANLKHAVLTGANLTAAKLEGAILQGADVAGVRLSAADLTRADLAELAGWQEIASVNYARLRDLKRSPRGFKEWALERGAEPGDAPIDSATHGYSEQFRAI